MGTRISRLEFRRMFAAIHQGLFIFESERRIPKELPVIHLGQRVSDRLCAMNADERRFQIDSVLREIIAADAAVHLTHIEVLFAPTLGINALGALLALCRNKKICLAWPGKVEDGRLIYGEPSQPDYYIADYSNMIDTYIITE